MIVAAFALGAVPAAARPPAPDPDPCTAPIEAAERNFAIPPRLLMAMAMVESGHANPAAGHATPWPWALNVNGTDAFPDSRQEAGRAVAAAQARGENSIDVGCMQVNLLQHPGAFASIDQALDPTANVAYAARFLVSLYRATGNWPTAVGFYHSHTPSLAEPYRTRVAAALPARAFPRAYVATVMDRRATLLRQLRKAWATATLPVAAPAPNTWYAWAQSVALKAEKQKGSRLASAP